MKICGIYKYIDLVDGKVLYVGQSRDIYKRHRSHTRDKKYNQPIDKKIQKDLRRYVLVYLECDEKDLNKLESYYINMYDPPYNFTKGGDYVHNKHKKGSKSLYTLWDSKKTHYISHKNQKRNRPFRWYYNGWYVPCNYFEEWFTIDLLCKIVEEAIKDEIK